MRYDALASGPTVYAYVRGNPVSYIDPAGLEGICGGFYCGSNTPAMGFPGYSEPPQPPGTPTEGRNGLAWSYLCAANGNSQAAEDQAMADRAARDWEALTPQGNALRDAENYLTAYSFVQNGANQWYGSLGAFGANAFMTHGWQALRYAQNSLGYEQQSPASVDALIAGYAGAYDAFNYPPIGTSGCGCGGGK